MLAERLAADGAEYCEAWNFGPAYSDAKPVRWIMDQLCRLWPTSIEWNVSKQAEPHEAEYLHLDCAKAHTKLLWWPLLRIEQALSMTCEWYIAHSRGEGVVELTREQIHHYSQLASVSAAE